MKPAPPVTRHAAAPIPASARCCASLHAREQVLCPMRRHSSCLFAPRAREKFDPRETSGSDCEREIPQLARRCSTPATPMRGAVSYPPAPELWVRGTQLAGDVLRWILPVRGRARADAPLSGMASFAPPLHTTEDAERKRILEEADRIVAGSTR